MTARYYAPHLSDAATCELEGSEFHHLAHVMRAGLGDSVVLFDGQGNSAEAQIVELSKSRAALRLANRRSQREDGPIVVLATAVPKADRFRWLVEKATELGVSRLIPLQTAHSVMEPGATKLDKMRAAVIEACKQSGRDRLMAIDPLTEWQAFLASTKETGRLLVAEPGGAPQASLCEVKQPERPLVLVVGPEGGFSDVEIIQAADAGGHCISLGSRILRTETAAIALAALCLLPCPERNRAQSDCER
jgi:16S rRNA (uracil1498-N3)-methyltransferase